MKRSRLTFHPRKMKASGFTSKQALQHEKTILEAHEITKLHKRDMMSSYNKFPRYAQPYKLIPTTSTTHPVNNETSNLYSEGATLSNFIHEGRPTTTKLTYVALPSSISHSTFHECSRGTPYQPQASLHKHLTKLVVITLYFLHLERKIISQSIFMLAGTPQRNPHRRS